MRYKDFNKEYYTYDRRLCEICKNMTLDKKRCKAFKEELDELVSDCSEFEERRLI